MIRLKASTFEILKNANSSSKEATPQLNGLVGVDDDAAFKALRDLCNKEKIDKVIVVYHDYTFSLLGVSFSDNKESETIPSDAANTYKFQARDVHLEPLAA